MYRFLVAIGLLTLCVTANAQDWVEHGGAEYNCTVLRNMLADYGDSDVQRSDDRVMTVSELVAPFFPNCPEAPGTAMSETSTESDTSSPETLFSFSSDEDGLQPVLGPLRFPSGVYVFGATTNGYMTVSPQSLSGDCGFDLKVAIFSISSGDASDGAESVVEVERDCNVLLEIGNTRESWLLDIVDGYILPVEEFATSYSANDGEKGLQPVLGPLALTAGVYVFTATTAGYMTVSPQSLSGDCGFDLMVAIFSLSRGEASNGAESVVDVERNCEVLFEIGNTSESWQLEISKLS